MSCKYLDMFWNKINEMLKKSQTLLCSALEKVRRPLLNDISFNTVELDFVDLPNYIKIKLLIGDCGFYINEIEGLYLDVIGRNLLKKLYHERNVILAQSNVL